MPDRIIRAELLDSEPWLALKDNTDRCCWLAVVLTCDNFGNLPAGPGRLVKLWRPFGVDTPEKADKVLAELHDCGLLGVYSVAAAGRLADQPGSGRHVHVHRFRQSLRYLGHLHALSPWTSDEEKQRLASESPVNHMRSPVTHGESHVDVDVDVVVEEERSNAAPVVVAGDNKKRGGRIADEWVLSKALGDWAMAQGFTAGQVRTIAAQFHDYWKAKSGANGVKRDWAATWRVWVREEVRRGFKRQTHSEKMTATAKGLYGNAAAAFEERARQRGEVVIDDKPRLG